MRTLFSILAVAAVSLLSMTAVTTAQQSITLQAGAVIDGKGGVQRNAVIAIEGSRIVRIGGAGAQRL